MAIIIRPIMNVELSTGIELPIGKKMAMLPKDSPEIIDIQEAIQEDGIIEWLEHLVKTFTEKNLPFNVDFDESFAEDGTFYENLSIHMDTRYAVQGRTYVGNSSFLIDLSVFDGMIAIIKNIGADT